MATPRAEFWCSVGGDGQPVYPWRRAASDPPPAPPTEVFWLERHEGMSDAHYESQAALGALPTFKAPQLA